VLLRAGPTGLLRLLQEALLCWCLIGVLLLLLPLVPRLCQALLCPRALWRLLEEVGHSSTSATTQGASSPAQEMHK
jgi:hypothetical protein